MKRTIQLNQPKIEIGVEPVAQDVWKKSKTAVNPWGLVDKYIPAAGSKAKAMEHDIQAIWSCKLCNVYNIVQNSEDKETDQIHKKLVQHLQKADHLGLFGKAIAASSEATVPDRRPEKVEFVRAMLSSTVTPTAVTRKGPLYDFFKRAGVDICSHVTFKKIAVEMAENAVEEIIETMKGQFITLSYDTSPAKDRRNFLTMNAHFVDVHGGYKKLNLGVIVVDGVVDGDDYYELVRDHLQILELDHLNWTDKTNTLRLGKGLVIAGVSDRGPGLYQCTGQLTGDLTRGSCCAHAQSLILQAAPKASKVLEDCMQGCANLSKEIRSNRDLRIEAKTTKLPMPSNPSKERWSRNIGLVDYTVSKYSTISRLANLEDKYLSPIKDQISLLESANENLFKLFGRTNNFLQTPGPGDALMVPYLFIATIAAIKSIEEIGDHLKPVQELMYRRLTRRLFNGQLNGIECYYDIQDGVDRTRIGDLFSNKIVLAMWAMCPETVFDCLVDYHFKTVEQVAALKLAANDALYELRLKLRPMDLRHSQQARAPTHKFAVSRPGAKPTDGATLRAVHDSELAAFRVQAPVVKAFEEAIHSVTAVIEGPSAYGDAPGSPPPPKDAREKLVRHFLMVAQGDRGAGLPKIDWLVDTIRATFGFVLTTVDCERDFSWLQLILDEHRLKMSDEMVAAYILGRKCPEYMKLSQDSRATSEHRDLRLLMQNGARQKSKPKVTTVAGTVPLITQANVQNQPATANRPAEESNVTSVIDLIETDDDGEQPVLSNDAGNDDVVSSVKSDVTAKQGDLEEDEKQDDANEKEQDDQPRKRVRKVNPRYMHFFKSMKGIFESRSSRNKLETEFEGMQIEDEPDSDECDVDDVIDQDQEL
jgi:hypothetical protein